MLGKNIKMRMNTKKIAIIAGALQIGMHAFMVNAAGIDDRVSVHGFGDTGYIRAVENNYTNKVSGSNWDYNYLSVNFTAQVDEKTKIVAEIRGGSEITSDSGAYVNYNLTDNLTARAGQMKAPIGIYNEIRDVKFLQLSTLEPLMYRDSAGTLPASFKGIGGIYHLDMGTHRLSFDIYGGEPKGSNISTATPIGYMLTKNIYGGRVTYKTPIGLRLSVSSFQNDTLLSQTTNAATDPNALQGPKKLSSLSLNYLSNNFDIKMEYAVASAFDHSGTAYYAQAGYTFAGKFTPYIRYDRLLYDNDKAEDPTFYQHSSVLGITYLLNRSVSLRVENHWNHGYAIPSTVQGTNFKNATAKLDWNIFAMGLNFIF